jgi:DNA-binding response OmpR family regulator
LASNIILFADDSATMRIIMEKTFAAEHYEVIAVPSGEAALSAARSKRPSIIVLDTGLSDLSGYDLCQTIRNDSSLRATPVILMSGVSHPYDEAKGLAAGASAFIKKPFDTGQLIEKVAELVGATTSDGIPLSDIEPIPLGVEPKLAPAPPAPPPAPMHSGAVAPMSIPVPKPALDPAGSSLRRPMGSKDTIEFGTMPRPAPPRPMAGAPQPLIMPPPSKAPVAPQQPPEAIKATTLAELAQMGQDGAPVAQTSANEAIELETPARQVPKPRVEIAAKVDEQAARIAQKVGGLTPEQVEAIRILSTEIVEKVVWEVVPELAETLIKEELSRLLQE